MTRWSDLAGSEPGESYAARIAAAAATGMDMHGEAALVERWLQRLGTGRRVLDAGCGTGRVAVRLADRGCDVVGVDLDRSMLQQARAANPDLDWRESDLARFRLRPDEGRFDVVVCAGNVIPLLAPGTLAQVFDALADTVAPTGVLISGFGLDSAHLPSGCPSPDLAEIERAAAASGLVEVERYASWQGEPYNDDGYIVLVHRPADHRNH
jgi:SAM-dependent methyltransferase